MEIITGAMTALITPFKNGKVDFSEEAKQSFWNFLEAFSKHTVNVDERLELEDLVVNKG